MLKAYSVEMTDGSVYKVIAFNTLHAKIKAFKRYKRTRNTNYKKFKSKLLGVRVLF